MSRIVITGNSHVAALIDAHASDPGRKLPDGFDEVYIYGCGGDNFAQSFHKVNDEDIEFICRSLRQPEKVIPVLTIKPGDNNFYAFHLFFNQEIVRRIGWHRFAPIDIAVGNEQPITRSLIDYMFDSHIRYIKSFITDLKKANVSFCVVEPPRLFKNKIIGLNSRRGCRFEVIVDIENHFRNKYKRFLADLQVPVLEAPVECLESDLTTKDIYSRNIEDDLFHANEAYGKIVLDQIYLFIKNSAA